MRSDRKRAEELRKSGKSYRHISRVLGVSKGTLSRWFKDELWSVVVREALIEKTSFASERGPALSIAKKEAAQKRRTQWRTEADALFRAQATQSPLFMLGVGMYWTHGDKNPNTRVTRLTSTDPGALRAFFRFLSECLGAPEEAIAATPLLYPGAPAIAQRRMWATGIGLPLERIRNETVLHGNTATQRRSLGACTITLSGAEWKTKILRLLERVVQDHIPLKTT
ncbi:MAG: helix-turn-helix domain-containing protein [Patescibacteria group bacterium]